MSELEKAIIRLSKEIEDAVEKIHDLIDIAPTIDAVEVVRCKDCKRRQEDTIFHKLYCDGREVVADGYCWKGEQDD